MSELLSVGQTLAGKYRVERHIGEGGMGVVVAARHTGFGQMFAIKVLTAGNEDELVKRFIREGRAAARIQSEHVAKVFDVGKLDDGAPFLVMELLEGRDLDAVLEQDGPLAIEDAVEYLLQACEALAEAHAMGVVHRDIKPANLFLSVRRDRTPHIKLLDFGISKPVLKGDAYITKLTSSHAVLGTPHFMSPEQLMASRDVDARADVWSLGAALFELLCGELPFDGRTAAELYTAIMRDPPKAMRELRDDIPEEVEAVVMRCLEKDAEDRYQTVAELVQELEPFAPARARVSVERIGKLIAPMAPTLRADPALAVTQKADVDGPIDISEAIRQAPAELLEPGARLPTSKPLPLVKAQTDDAEPAADQPAVETEPMPEGSDPGRLPLPPPRDRTLSSEMSDEHALPAAIAEQPSGMTRRSTWLLLAIAALLAIVMLIAVFV